MEEIKRFHSSRRGFRAHLSRIVDSIQRIVQREPSSPLSDADIASLSDFREQLMRKKEILVDLDAKIANFINKEDELEAEIFESEEIQETISQQAARIAQAVEHHLREHTPPTRRTLPIVTTDTGTIHKEIREAETIPETRDVDNSSSVVPHQQPKVLLDFQNLISQCFLEIRYIGSLSGIVLKPQYTVIPL